MTIYSAANHRTLVDVAGEIESQWAIEKLVGDMAAAGFLSLSIGNSAPADTSFVWLEVAGTGPQGSTGVAKLHDGTAWVVATKALLHRHLGGWTHTASATAPANPVHGDEWHDTANGIIYKRTNDGTSDIWIDVSTPGGGGGGGATAPVAWGL